MLPCPQAVWLQPVQQLLNHCHRILPSAYRAHRCLQQHRKTHFKSKPPFPPSSWSEMLRSLKSKVWAMRHLHPRQGIPCLWCCIQNQHFDCSPNTTCPSGKAVRESWISRPRFPLLLIEQHHLHAGSSLQTNFILVHGYFIPNSMKERKPRSPISLKAIHPFLIIFKVGGSRTSVFLTAEKQLYHL